MSNYPGGRTGTRRPSAFSEDLAAGSGGRGRRGASAASGSGASGRSSATRRPGVVARFRGWMRHHAQVFLHSLARLVDAPVSFAMTAAVLGVAMALPAVLYMLVANLEGIDAQWEGSARISLYLAAETTDEQALTFAKSLAHSPDIAHIELIPKDQAMAEFRTFSGFGEVVEALGENPLPPVLMIRAHEERSRQAVEDLAANLRSLNEVEMATVDIAWMERLFALVDFSQRLIWMIAGLLGLTVLLIVGNTIRLDIHNRREEIEVVKLVGGTNSFIRRPFLYSGIWYGIVAGVLAFVLVEIARWTLHGPVRRMAESYGSNIAIDSIGFLGLVALILAGVLLGLAGSWLAVSYHVRRIEPA